MCYFFIFMYFFMYCLHLYLDIHWKLTLAALMPSRLFDTHIFIICICFNCFSPNKSSICPLYTSKPTQFCLSEPSNLSCPFDIPIPNCAHRHANPQPLLNQWLSDHWHTMPLLLGGTSVCPCIHTDCVQIKLRFAIVLLYHLFMQRRLIQ